MKAGTTILTNFCLSPSTLNLLLLIVIYYGLSNGNHPNDNNPGTPSSSLSCLSADTVTVAVVLQWVRFNSLHE